MNHIPFALDKNGEYVEVGNVPKGKNCNCFCPSCEQSVIARHGKKKAWHFAHDPNPATQPKRICDLSFESCCRQYLSKLLTNGAISTLSTPALNVQVYVGERAEFSKAKKVTSPHQFKDLRFTESNYADIKTEINGYTLYLFFYYGGRAIPPEPDDEKAGVIEVDIGFLKFQYAKLPSEPDLIAKLLTALIEEDNDLKSWLYHPNAKAARQHLEYELIAATKKQLTAKGTYSCLNCKHEWYGTEHVDHKCPNCDKYLYSRFEPSASISNQCF